MLVWIALRQPGLGPIISVLDDFLFIARSERECAASLASFQEMCRCLHVPLHPARTVPSCQVLQFLGVELDTAARALRLPPDKLERARVCVSDLLRLRKVPLRQVQSCVGLLNFACLAIPLSRPFLLLSRTSAWGSVDCTLACLSRRLLDWT